MGKKTSLKKAILKKELFTRLENEITDLEQQVKKARFDNLKIGAVRNLKVAGAVLHGLYPYALCAGMVVGGGVALDMGLPFMPHKYRTCEKYAVTINSANDEKIRETSLSREFVDKICVFGNWEQNPDGTYGRAVDTYKIDEDAKQDFSIGRMHEIVKNKDIEFVKSSIGNPKISIQTRTAIPADIYTTDADVQYIEATYTGENKNKTGLVAMTSVEIARKSLAAIGVFMSLLLIPLVCRDIRGYNMFKNVTRAISDNQPDNTVGDLKKLLAFRRQNYKMLGGEK